MKKTQVRIFTCVFLYPQFVSHDPLNTFTFSLFCIFVLRSHFY
ncbi:hypothetical protein [Morganella morganii IS15]|nr:hypothetical protein CSB69_1590 [Morganella morganii]EMP53820.1 hypothetical protein C790_00338 [Morganella morganii SC01]CDK65319.1 hypothetical protein [Morganella morganii IS15]